MSQRDGHSAVNHLHRILFFFLPGSSATGGIEEREWLAKEHRGKDHVPNNSYTKYMYIQIVNNCGTDFQVIIQDA